VARNRQRAKQRQAERRARRLAEQGGAEAQPRADEPAAEPEQRPEPLDDPTTVEPSPAVPPELATGAPPQNEGRSDTVLDDEPALESDQELEREALQEIEDWEVQGDGDGDAEAAAYQPRGRRGREAAEVKDRPRVIQFLIAVWAELQRVQWPNRQALTTLTGVVLGFVLIAGGYLGLLDAIVSELIQALL
jgi:preprotein translocase subunit SecE